MINDASTLIEKGLVECNCKYCGCMHMAISKASEIIDTTLYQNQLAKEEKDCYGCDPCYGAEAYNIAISSIKDIKN